MCSADLFQLATRPACRAGRSRSRRCLRSGSENGGGSCPARNSSARAGGSVAPARRNRRVSVSWRQAIAALSTSGGSETADRSAKRAAADVGEAAVGDGASPADAAPRSRSRRMQRRWSRHCGGCRATPTRSAARQPESRATPDRARRHPACTSIGGPKARKPMAAASRKMAVVSATFQRPSARKSPKAHSTTTGTMIRLAAASASHQLIPVASHTAELLTSMSPASIAPPSATAAPISAVGTKATSANSPCPGACRRSCCHMTSDRSPGAGEARQRRTGRGKAGRDQRTGRNRAKGK